MKLSANSIPLTIQEPPLSRSIGDTTKQATPIQPHFSTKKTNKEPISHPKSLNNSTLNCIRELASMLLNLLPPVLLSDKQNILIRNYVAQNAVNLINITETKTHYMSPRHTTRERDHHASQWLVQGSQRPLRIRLRLMVLHPLEIIHINLINNGRQSKMKANEKEPRLTSKTIGSLISSGTLSGCFFLGESRVVYVQVVLIATSKIHFIIS